jgi:hypothetical protein
MKHVLSNREDAVEEQANYWIPAYYRGNDAARGTHA